MFNPTSTYRIQFNKDFTFSHLAEVIPLLVKLGIRTIYASPVFKAVPGSTHGYDIVNPFEINPEIGSIDQLREITATLKSHGIGWIQDIVPNHMAFHHTNPWLMDVLEKGSLSVYASVFDVTWAGEFYHARLMVPFLGASLDDVISNNELRIVYWNNRLCLHHSDQYYPINSRAYGYILGNTPHAPENVTGFIEQLENLHHITDPVQYALRWHELLLQFSALMNESTGFIENELGHINQRSEHLLTICNDQFYRLCFWKETEQRINYRRFFLVNGLICLNIQSEKVFQLYHEAIGAYVKEGLFQGVRVDHVDGLYDPKTYLERLRALCGEECYIVVEKILEPGEALPTDWLVQGTTGYDFLGLVNNFFTRNSAENKFSSFYRSLTRDTMPVAERVREKKRFILENYMKGELENLYQLFSEKNPDKYTQSTPEDLKKAIGEFLIEIPVYRYYGNELPLTGAERDAIGQILKRCLERSPELADSYVLLQDALLGPYEGNTGELTFYQRCMQFTGPLMAKGVEDTLMYTYHRFLAHNEVGDSPEFFGLSVDDFHHAMKERRNLWPLTINSTSTHDTKRGEDARMRLNVLPDIADRWIDHVKDWMNMNSGFKMNGSPDSNDEYFIYQTLIGVFPFQREDDFEERLKLYFTKALREAKRFSDWGNPDQQYEDGVHNFVHQILQPDTSFMQSFIAFQKSVADYGIINSLAQLTLKFTCPGIPDTYQGTWDWDLTLVDPDNRRPIDYSKLDQSLAEIEILTPHHDCIAELWSNRWDGHIKLWMIQQLLKFRMAYAHIIDNGEYVPLELEGRYSTQAMAFARQLGDEWIVVIVPLSMARFRNTNGSVWQHDWQDTRVILPACAPSKWKSILREKEAGHEGAIPLSEVLNDFPIAVLSLEEVHRSREAGLLLSITSLPSKFGIGDLGIEARRFADFLRNSRQHIWQLLPLNPVDKESGYSPYSSCCSMAGNELLISLEDLVDAGLLTGEDLKGHEIINRGTTDYKKAAAVRNKLLEAAWINFNKGTSLLHIEFEAFLKQEAFWLDDFALFRLLKEKENNKPWYQWPALVRDRNADRMELLTLDHRYDLLKLKWLQFIFFYQWKKLRSYCTEKGIALLGDLPFYVAYDSVDVWANRDIFKLANDGSMTGIAGVPPDYFAETGQLWNMPVFNWDKLREKDYKWWVWRIGKNLELFDRIRLDHFRAFVDYWEVSRGEETAINGKWMKGPGIDFFNVLRDTFGSLPFIAEDLGEITPDVFALRDELKLPGMKVLQFAFGKGLADNPYAPHHHRPNFVAYTGTHDNNTTRGWYRNDVGSDERRRLDSYTNKTLSSRKISAEMMHMAYVSVANTAIIPMQDVLGLDANARMNTPSKTTGNWTWRLREIPDDETENRLAALVRIYGR